MIRFRENFLGNQINVQEQKKKMMETQQNVKGKIEEGKKVGEEVKVKVEDWLRGKKGEAVNKLDGVTDLKTRWLLAQQQKSQGEEAYNKAEKDWYTFSKGGLWYQNYLENKVGVSVNKKKGNMEGRFNDRVDELKKLIQVYKEKNDNKNNVGEMNKNIQAETEKMAAKVNFGLNAKNINNRMSDWYEEQNEFFENANWYVSKFYWISLIVMSVLVLIKFKLENKKLLAVIVLFIALPFFTNKFTAWIFDLHSNNCPTYLPSLGFEAGKSKTCQVKPTQIPVDCEMGAWEPCNAVCGGGQMKRKIVMEAMYGGRPCGETTKSCNTQPCKKGQDPKEKKTIKEKAPTENVLIEMTKNMWTSFQQQLTGAKLKNKSEMCQAKAQAQSNAEQSAMLSSGLGKMSDFAKKLDVKDLGKGVLDQAKKIKQKGETLADDVAKKAGSMKDDITSSTEDRFDIISRECLGKYCR